MKLRSLAALSRGVAVFPATTLCSDLAATLGTRVVRFCVDASASLRQL